MQESKWMLLVSLSTKLGAGEAEPGLPVLSAGVGMQQREMPEIVRRHLRQRLVAENLVEQLAAAHRRQVFLEQAGRLAASGKLPSP